VFLLGLLALILPAVLGLRRRRLWHLTPWLLTMPVYLILVSAAAWLAMADLVRRPFHWVKTEHGVGARRPNLFRNRR
jgi:glycosyltransferase XagB